MEAGNWSCFSLLLAVAVSAGVTGCNRNQEPNPADTNLAPVGQPAQPDAQASSPPTQAYAPYEAEGYGAEEARRLVATAVVVELFHVMRDQEPFNRERFVWNLAHLPHTLWDEDGQPRYPGDSGASRAE